MKKIEAFAPGGLHALLSQILQIKKTADGNTSAVSDLGGDHTRLTTLVAAELDGKQDKPQATACTIPAAGWEQDGTAGYPCCCDLRAEGVTARDRAQITIAPASLEAAVQCGLCPTCETFENIIRIRSASIPKSDMAAECWIEKGR